MLPRYAAAPRCFTKRSREPRPSPGSISSSSASDADDRDAQPALAHPVGLGSLVQHEALTLVDDLDGDVLLAELVHDLNASLAPGLVRMANRVRACLRERELEVVERLVARYRAGSRCPARARRQSVMYSAFAGMVSRTMRASGGHRVNAIAALRSAAGRGPGRPLAERDRDPLTVAPAQDGEASPSVPGSSRWPTSRTTSLPLRTARPSIARMTSPPPVTCAPSKLSCFVPACRPARSPGLSGLTQVMSAPVETGTSRKRASAGVRSSVVIPTYAYSHLSAGEQLSHRPPHGVDRHGEADALAPTGVAADLRVDPDHPAATVQQRAAGVAVVDRGVGLDRVRQVVLGRDRRDRASRGRDDADRERVLVAERAADRGHGLADDDVRGGCRAGAASGDGCSDRP